MSIAYLSNRFPEPVESYVGDEIRELRQRGCQVLSCSVRQPDVVASPQARAAEETLYVFPLSFWVCLSASWLCVKKFHLISDLVWRVLSGPESVSRRCRTLVHTWLGANLASLLRKNQIQHLHVHHGYFASWVGMVAARLLGASFSMTLHGSDLLVRADYLDAKLKHCRFCVTVSDFNRIYIAGRFPEIDPQKIMVQRLGVDPAFWRPRNSVRGRAFSILTVGRLHPTKNHTFLLRACAELKSRCVTFRCVIAGEGEERARLQQLIADLNLHQEVVLLGHVPRERLPDLYAEADVVVLTSRSEGLPLTLMEAMAMERVVLAPNITGIPELVTHGVNGFLFTPDSMEDFLAKLHLIRASGQSSDLDLGLGLDLDALRQAARREVDLYFNSRVNLAGFAECFLKHPGGVDPSAQLPRKETHENPVLQQVQLHLQRDRSLPV